MNQQQSNLYRFLVGLGDDAVVLSHRLSEWCSNGPYLEEDIALSNIALDYIGRARMFYQYAVEVEGKGRTEDDIAYLRTEREYTNLLIHELPINDFAFTMVRQFFVDVFYCEYLEKLSQSNDERIAAIAAKAVKESRYHLKRSEPWIRQLSEGTDESRRRIQAALVELENFVGELFIMSDWEKELVAEGVAVDREVLQSGWDKYVQAFLAQSEINFPDSQLQIRGGRDGIHTEHLGHMLSEMQYMQRAYPGLQW
ncbi:1,2-phenylacetyl-CoA epoxidase subunit PaaC [Aliikangiella coralliicola]|uniref:Phenylacetate-CoA oxygenase subunit PaaC n=1 Tax=Aliikangiella coralliicola TaxID=2592383 RepID=A0A545TSR2_9GAMM|nr:1,2-phenylacetyl-CoA epoxidase subunit PaaC [Aliikangiella coralliicola]TQV80257.1 phenylacetate-CoA oxygenase subunit PaaC [Aliikangiella coralliicola]